MTTSNTDDSLAWWRTVTPIEFGESEETVVRFIDGSGAPEQGECEMFARALALRQLLADNNAILNALSRASEIMARLSKSTAEEHGFRHAKAWLPRGMAVAEGLARGAKLLRPPESFVCLSASSKVAAECSLLEMLMDSISNSIHAVVRSPLHVGLPDKFKRV
jgi:hypothetical protein